MNNVLGKLNLNDLQHSFSEKSLIKIYFLLLMFVSHPVIPSRDKKFEKNFDVGMFQGRYFVPRNVSGPYISMQSIKKSMLGLAKKV